MSDKNPSQTLQLDRGRSRTFHCTERMEKMSKKLACFYENAEFCDITLIAEIDGFKLEAHRMVLSASSGYFEAMFRSNLREANMKEVALPQWNGETLKAIVDYMYNNSIELRLETVENLLRAADFFQISDLITACCCFMIEEMDPCNCLRLVFLAEQHNYVDLYAKSLHFACVNFEEVCTEQEFFDLDVQQLIRFLELDDICVLSERSVVCSVLKWIKHDEENRRPSVLQLLQYIRFPLLDARYIAENKDSLCVDSECSTVVLDWLQYLLSPQSRARFPNAVTRPRQSCQKLYFISGEDNAQCMVQTFDSELNEWKLVSWPQPKKGGMFVSAAIAFDKQLILGGNNSNGVEQYIECLDLQTMKWSLLPSMSEPRGPFAMCALNGFLYTVGGVRAPCFNDNCQNQSKQSSR